MNELAINIEYLLLSHNNVIVPSLGMFRTMNTPARWIEAEKIYLPPVRNVHFDPSITSDPEEFFLQSLSDIYRLTPEEALQRCEDLVTEFHKALITEGSVDFGSIGIFTLEEDATISMASCECGVLTPTLYGLDALHIGKLEKNLRHEECHTQTNEGTRNSAVESTAETQATVTLQANERPSLNQAESDSKQASENTDGQRTVYVPASPDEHITFKVRRSVVNYTMAIVASLILFFIIQPTRPEHTQKQKQGDHATMTFLQPNMVHEALNVHEEYYHEEPCYDENTETSFDAVLVDVTENALNEGIALGATATESNTLTTTKLPKTNGQENIAQAQLTEQPKAMPTKVVQPSAEKPKPEQSKAEQPKTIQAGSQPQSTVVQAQHGKQEYVIVLASAISRANAENYIQKLAKMGVKANLVETNLRRVVINGFADEAQARAQMKTLKEKDSNEFGSAWILKL